ncbi:MAG: glutaredoxin family protein [Chloroflexi bacterium]|nr:glutaredoxin family protein [Chloroflexota bacterium]
MRVLLYSKADCHLCDAFHFELLDLQSELGFAYEKRHLQEGGTLFAEFDGHFPVVDIETTDTAEPIRLISPTSQRQLRAQIRQSASLSSPAGTH